MGSIQEIQNDNTSRGTAYLMKALYQDFTYKCQCVVGNLTICQKLASLNRNLRIKIEPVTARADATE